MKQDLSTLDYLYEKSLGNSIEPPKNFYKDSIKIPWSLKIPFGEVDDPSVLSEKDWNWWIINRNEVFNALLIAWAGSLKTTLVKRFLTYYYFHNYDCLLIDPKEHDMVDCKNLGSGKRLYREETKTSLPIYSCLPTFALKRNSKKSKLDNSIVKLFDLQFSQDIDKVDEVIEWSTLLEVEFVGAIALNKYKHLNDLQEMGKRIVSDSTLNPGTKKSLINRIISSIQDEIFSNEFKKFNLKQIWDNKQIPSINFFSRESRYQRYLVGDIINQIKLYSEYKNRNKFIVYDDCSFYFDSLPGIQNYAVEMGINTMIHWRLSKFNQFFICQNPRKINETIIEECKHKFIGSIGNPELLRDIIGDNNVFDALSNLRYIDYEGKAEIDVEYIHIFPNKRRYETGFIGGSCCGHKW